MTCMRDDRPHRQDPDLSPVDAARMRLLTRPHEPLFFADWKNVLMIHLEVEPGRLQPAVPFELDLRDGRAFVSLVAFHLVGMRPRRGGRVLSRLFRADSFLNLRTYVIHEREPGIFFLAEWLSNRLSIALGPLLFGLPYRIGKLAYNHSPQGHSRVISGRVASAPGEGLSYWAQVDGAGTELCARDSITEWLLERYTAFTEWRGSRRFFRVWHEPWRQTRARVELLNWSLLGEWPFLVEGQICAANFSPGVEKVWMGWPHRLSK